MHPRSTESRSSSRDATVPRSWRGDLRAPATVRELGHVLPALALLCVPVIIAVLARLPGTADLERGVPMLRGMLIGGLAPLLVAGGIARLKGRSLSGAARLLWSEGWLTERPVRHLLMSVSLAAFVEYNSMYFGFQSLYWLAVALYGAALILFLTGDPRRRPGV